jgi:hypothetical protein
MGLPGPRVFHTPFSLFGFTSAKVVQEFPCGGKEFVIFHIGDGIGCVRVVGSVREDAEELPESQRRGHFENVSQKGHKFPLMVIHW